MQNIYNYILHIIITTTTATTTTIVVVVVLVVLVTMIMKRLSVRLSVCLLYLEKLFKGCLSSFANGICIK